MKKKVITRKDKLSDSGSFLSGAQIKKLADEKLVKIRECSLAKNVLSKEQKVLLSYFSTLLLILATYFSEAFYHVINILMGVLFLSLTLHKFIMFALAAKSVKNTKFSNEISDQYRKQLLSLMKDKRLPYYNIMLPLYQECYGVISNLVSNISLMKYDKKKLKVLLVVEEADKETLHNIKRVNLPEYFEIVIAKPGYPQTKGRACNYALDYAKGDYLVIYDAEDKPDPYQILKAVKTFREFSKGKFPPSKKPLACLQAKLNYYNRNETLITNMFAVEYCAQFDYAMHTMVDKGMAIPLGGSSNHFDLRFLKSIGGWDSYNVTEDADIGIRIAKAGYSAEMLDSYTMEEATLDVISWLKQRTRWIKGHMQTFLVHNRFTSETPGRMGARSYINFTCLMGLSTFTPLLAFISFLSVLIEAKFHQKDMISVSTEAIFFVFNFTLWHCVLLYILIVLKKRMLFSLKVIFFAPLYYMLHIIASVEALKQLIIAPHYWNKTSHGLTSCFKGD